VNRSAVLIRFWLCIAAILIACLIPSRVIAAESASVAPAVNLVHLLVWDCRAHPRFGTQAQAELNVEFRRLGKSLDFNRRVAASVSSGAATAAIELPEGIYVAHVRSGSCAGAGIMTVFSGRTNSIAIALENAPSAATEQDLYTKPLDSVMLSLPFPFSYAKVQTNGFSEVGSCDGKTCTWDLLLPGTYRVIVAGPNWTATVCSVKLV